MRHLSTVDMGWDIIPISNIEKRNSNFGKLCPFTGLEYKD